MSDVTLIDARVTARSELATDICALEIEASGRVPLPAVDAGAHIDVHVGGFVRQYSLLGPPTCAPERYRIAVLRTTASRGGSEAVHRTLQVGSSLRISAPRNHFALRLDGAPAVLVAGGIGITPILCMAAALHGRRTPFELHYCGRSIARMALVDELLGSPYARSVHLHVDDAPSGRFDVGRVLSRQPAHAHLYVCGPQGFMDHVLGSARAAGWTDDRLHHECFQPAAAASGSGDRPFELWAVRSGQRIVVRADESALQALRRSGIQIASSCEQGVCGSCLIPVVAGLVDHRDSFLTAQEKAAHAEFLPCCSRALENTLTIDA